MPQRHPPAHPHPGTYRTMLQAASDGEVYELRCNLCRRTVAYLVTDLIKFDLVAPSDPIYTAVWPCSRCGTGEWVVAGTRKPAPEEYGRLTVRRPRWLLRWRKEALGDKGQ